MNTRIFHRAARATCATLAVSSLTLHAWTGPLPSLPVAMNIQGASYWDRVPYLDPMLGSGAWIAYHEGGPWDDQTADSLAIRPDGWPTRSPQMVGSVRTKMKTMVNNCRAGDYTLTYQGKGKLTWNGGSSERSAASGKVIRFDGSCEHAWMTVDSSDAADPVRDLHLTPVEYASTPGGAPLFDPDFVRGLKAFHALRFMDWTATNGSRQVKWSDRPVPGYRTFGEGKGMPWEHAIALSNQLGAHAWICTPHAADDDYLQKLAVLFRDSLRQDLHTYVEYSNEVWNWGFDQAHWVGQNGMDVAWDTKVHGLLAADPIRDSLKKVGLRVCGDTASYCHPEKDAWMMGRLFRIWEPVWASQRSRLVTVATGQHAWTDNSRRILGYLIDTMKIRPDAFSVAGYMGFEIGEGDPIPQSVIPRAHDSLLNNYFHDRWMKKPDTVKASDVVKAIGIGFTYTTRLWTLETVRILKSFKIGKFLVYEGGQHAQPHNQGDWPYNQAVWDAQIDQGMYDLYLKNLQLHDSVDCALYAAFSYVGGRESKYGSWGHLETYAQSALTGDALRKAAPKYAALLDANEPKSGVSLRSVARAGIASPRPVTAMVVDGRLQGWIGAIEVRSLDGRKLYTGDTRSMPKLRDGMVVAKTPVP
ncbi:MAG: hypothetical protein IPN71_12850 [Fibrobacteres bacterium]|nr:hypothetical protein [Fibrobacterota bacterium]